MGLLSPLQCIVHVCEDLEKNNIDYTILNGLDPETGVLGRDIDVLVCSGDMQRARSIAVDNLRSEGFRIAVPPDLWGARVIGCRTVKNGIQAVEMHFIDNFVWRGVLLQDGPDLNTVRRHRVKFGKLVGFKKRVILPLLSVRKIPFEKKGTRFHYSWEEGESKKYLARVLGEKLANEIESAFNSRDWVGVERLRSRVRLAFLYSAFRRPLSFITSIAKTLWRNIGQGLYPCAPTLAFVGVNGSKKSDIISRLEIEGVPPFTSIVCKDMGFEIESIFTDDNAEYIDGHKAKLMCKRRTHKVGLFIWMGRILRSVMDKWWGDRRASSRQKLVLYENSILNLIADSPCNISKLQSFLHAWIQKYFLPDLLFILKADTNIICESQSKILAKRTLKIQDFWMKLLPNIDCCYVIIDVDMDIEAALIKIREKIVEHFIKMHIIRGSR